jgi:RNA polymerase sigma-70 factor (ECF subfamily)
MSQALKERVFDTTADRTEELVREAVKDISKFAALYNLHYVKVYQFVFKRTSDRELSFDLTSTVFLKAMENLKNYRYTGVPFEAWLFRIALNEVYGMYRKKKLQLVYHLDLNSIHHFTAEIDIGDRELMIKRVLDLLPKLRKNEMDLIEMRYFSKHSVIEIATILNISENNASVRIFRVLKKVKTLYQKKYSHGII